MDPFTALAEPTRRSIVEMLGRGALSAGEIGARFAIGSLAGDAQAGAGEQTVPVHANAVE